MRTLDAGMFRLLRPLVTRAMRLALRDRLPPGSAEGLLRETWRKYEALARDLPGEPTVGARLMVRLAAATVGFYESLRSTGLTEHEAEERTTKAAWLVYEKLTAPAWTFTALLAWSRIRRVRRAMDMFMRFPYAPPGYRMHYVKSGKDVVAFDVCRCPPADYFRRQGLPGLCVVAFCNLDYPMAAKWRVRLERSQVLASGASHCDFRFRARSEDDEREARTPRA